VNERVTSEKKRRHASACVRACARARARRSRSKAERGRGSDREHLVIQRTFPPVGDISRLIPRGDHAVERGGGRADGRAAYNSLERKREERRGEERKKRKHKPIGSGEAEKETRTQASSSRSRRKVACRGSTVRYSRLISRGTRTGPEDGHAR